MARKRQWGEKKAMRLGREASHAGMERKPLVGLKRWYDWGSILRRELQLLWREWVVEKARIQTGRMIRGS